ncbi:hypothetical protein MJH12_13400, partial [bacterium]|nr:hypothetical protein [bacterium]
FSNPTQFRLEDLGSTMSQTSRNTLLNLRALSAHKNIFIHSISIKKSQLDILDFKESQTIKKALEFFPSHFETQSSMILLGLFFFIFVLFFTLRIRKKIGLKILLGFFVPILFGVIFLSVQGLSDFLSSIESSELYKVQKKLHAEVLKVNLLGEKIENDFMYTIEKVIIPQVKKTLKKFREQQIDLDRNHYSTYRASRSEFQQLHPNKRFREASSLHTKENTLDIHLEEICQSHNLNIMFANKSTIFFSSDYYTSKAIRHISSIFQKYIQNELTGQSGKNKNSREAIKTIKDLMSNGFDDTKILDRFMNNPAQLFHLKIRSMGASEQVSKTFWSYLVENYQGKKLVWFLFGGVGKDALLIRLKEHLNTLFSSKKHFAEHYFFYGENILGTFGSKKIIDNQMLELAALAKQSLSLAFVPKIRQNKLYFYSYHIYEPSPGYSFVLQKSGDDYLKEVQKRKNNIYYSIYLLFLFIYLCSYLLSIAVTNPLLLLSQGMNNIKEGKLKNDLVSQGKDQFSEVTQLLNFVLQSLREKEHLSKFLSNMVLNSLDSKGQVSKRQDQYIMFCGIQNLQELEENIGLENVVILIDQFLQTVQNIIVNHRGRIDKFTGKSSLSVFETHENSEMIVQLLVELQRSLSEFTTPEFHNIKIKFGVGLAKGPVVLGHVGSEQRKDFTAIGSTVNKAARLEALAMKSKDLVNIYFDQPFFDSFQNIDKLNYTTCQSVFLKGYKREQSVYELL